jgi:uncharacterized membrane protein
MRDSILRAALLAVVLLTAEGFALGMASGFVSIRSDLRAFVLINELPAHSRQALWWWLLATAGTFASVGLCTVLLGSSRSILTCYRWALRLSPLLLSPLVALLANRWLWQGQDVLFLALLSLLGLGGLVLFRDALSQPCAKVRFVPGAYSAWVNKLRELLEKSGSALPFALVVIGVLGYAAVFSYFTIAFHRNVYSSSFDIGIFDNLMWNLVHGGPFLKASPELGPSGSHFGVHANLLAYPLALIYALAPGVETLLVIQATFLGGAAVPLFLFARRHVGNWPACLLACCYLLYPPVHGTNLYEFHFLALAPFFVLCSVYLIEARHDLLAVITVILTLLVREDVAAAMMVVGAYFVVSGLRPRAGLVLSAVSLLWFALMKFWLMPMVGGTTSFLEHYRGLLPAGEGGFIDVILTLITNPAFVMSTLLDVDKLVYFLQIMAPLAFLPLYAPVGLLLLAPGFIFTLLSTGYAPLIQISFQYTAHWTPFVFIAATLSLAQRRRAATNPGRRGRAQARADVLVMALVMVIASYQYGAILQRETTRGGFGPYYFGTTANDLARRAALQNILTQLPAEAKVVATERLVPQVSNRPDAYTLRVGTFDAEYLLFATARPVLISSEDIRALRSVLSSGEFGVVAQRGPFGLARRGATTHANWEVLARLPEARN